MKTFLRNYLTGVLLCIGFSLPGYLLAQTSSKSLLINHGGTACGSANAEQHFFAGSLTNSPTLVGNGSIGLPYYSVFTAYNPVDHKVYYSDIGSGGTKVYAVDFNLGGQITYPSSPTATYVYNYVLNQLCFDNNGNNYGFYGFDAATGTAKISQVEISTGLEKAGTQRTVQFPAGDVPNTVGDGDIVILPNGRMFATFGNAPSKLYELSNPTAAGPVTATFLTNLPRLCFSIGFVDGNLVVAGSDGGGCYYYVWDINSFTLSTASAFPMGRNSADMSNLTVAVGSTKALTGVNVISSNTARLYYQIVIKNKGNILLNNIQVIDDLAKAFGAANLSNLQISFATNPNGLVLNPNYDGISDINLLTPGQTLNNYPVTADSAVLNLTVTVTNLEAGKVYYNSAIASGSIGAGSTYLAVSDSSNNGNSARMDLDGNGVSDDVNENVPTPFIFGAFILPVKGISLQGVKSQELVKLNWKDLSAEGYESYDVERSIDNQNFEKLASFNKRKETDFQFNDDIQLINSEIVYYRVKGLKADKTILFSNTVNIRTGRQQTISAYPNPFTQQVSLHVIAERRGTAKMIVQNMSGKILLSRSMLVEKGLNKIVFAEMEKLVPGIYLLDIQTGIERKSIKLIKQ